MIKIDTTPGKPGAPSEFIVAVAENGGFGLKAGRVTDGREESQTSSISAWEYLGLCRLVSEYRLDTFHPVEEEGGGQVFDFGEMGIEVVTAGVGGAEASTNSARWSSKISNQHSVNSLFDTMIDLAGVHFDPGFLHYLRPADQP